jgi:glycosyltransferase involved in cell wall biosynthesis
MFTIRYGIDTDSIDEFRKGFDRDLTRRSLGFSAADQLIVCVGTFEPRKQQTVLAQAFASVAPRYPDARLALVGRSHMHAEYVSALETYIERARMSDRILSLPVTPRVFDWYAAADLFALSSDTESMPRTFLESMCFGVPVLATGAYGVPELIEDGVDGFLVEPNELKALASKLDELLCLERNALRQVGARARSLIQTRYAAAGYATEYLRLIDQMR